MVAEQHGQDTMRECREYEVVAVELGAGWRLLESYRLADKNEPHQAAAAG